MPSFAFYPPNRFDQQWSNPKIMPHSLPALRLQRQAMAFPLNAPAFKPLAAAQGWARSEAVSGEMARNN
ncbi:hypothetical protein [Sinorhizobium fredii]|uniref:hypothetical protein n=1 Tax=Rhizobium fredii TaxID=380 RepID=UPI00117D7D16|nr:hypothetical protein [Sinorhizobium fredii]